MVLSLFFLSCLIIYIDQEEGFSEEWRPRSMTTTPKNQTAYFDIELPLTVDQLSAAGNLSSSFPAPFHLSLFHKLEFIQPEMPLEVHSMISSG